MRMVGADFYLSSWALPRVGSTGVRGSMFSPKKIIPRLAIAALPLAGTACGAGSDGGLPQDNVTDAINAFCMTVARCYPGYDMNECVNYEQAFAEYARNYGEACVNVVASYFQCLSELSCEDYIDYGPGFQACETEINDTFEAACSK